MISDSLQVFCGAKTRALYLLLYLIGVSALAVPSTVRAGTTGSLTITPTVTPGNALTLSVTDADLNSDALSQQTTTINVVNNVTGESELVTLSELGINSNLFFGNLATTLNPVAGTSNDGVLDLRGGATATATYIDTLTGTGGNASLTAVTNATGGADFFKNFLLSAYYMPVFPLDGEQFGGDLTATYDQMYVPNRPNLELLIIGEFPRSRYFAITATDDHGAVISTLYDAQLQPLRFTDTNPFQIGGPANTEDILYAVRVQLGDQLATNPFAGCQFEGVDTQSNLMDVRYRHTGGTRYSANQSGFTATSPDGTVTVAHDDNIENQGVSFLIRRYLSENDNNTGAFNMKTPLVFVRDSTTGCALNMFQLVGRTQTSPTEKIKPSDWFGFHTVMDAEQLAAHDQHEKDAGTNTPFGLDPGNRAAWYGGREYILSANPDTGYLATTVGQAGAPSKLNADGKVMRMRFRVPQMPCSSPACVLTGAEEMRYWGISFVEGPRHVFGSISDLDVTPDANGYVTLIVTFGTALPPHINTDNGYSVLQLPALPLRLITMRNILPAAGFPCALDAVPFYTNEHNDQGGYLGEYAPYIDYVVPTNLPLTASPRVEVGSCAQ